MYSGEKYIYIFFTITSTLLLHYGFRKNAIFFDTFLAVFLWLGFWLKATIRIGFLDSKFREAVGVFDGSGDSFDQTLLVCSFAFLTLILASHIREKFLFNYSDKDKEEKTGLFLFYSNYRKIVLVSYVFLFSFVAITNLYFGIYQRGEITQTILPYGLSGIYKWLLLFGLSSFAALILKYEFMLEKKTTYLVPILTLVEACMTSVSLLSRAMVLNASSLGFGMLKEIANNKIKTNMRFYIIAMAVFFILFLSSVFLVNQIRHTNDYSKAFDNVFMDTRGNISKVKILLLDRFVGIEGMLAISSSSKKSWDLLNEALHEKYDENKTSFYDLNLITSPYRNLDTSKQHYISLPGYIAFFYYSGSVVFLCSALFVLSIIASSIEYLSYKLSGRNLIFASLIAQVVAYRYTHFGYVPAQSYLLFASILLNIFIFYFANKFISRLYKKMAGL